MSIRIDMRELIEYRDKLVEVQNKIPIFTEKCVKILAQRLLAMTIKRTPVGDYKKNNLPQTYKRNNSAKGIRAGDVKIGKNGQVIRSRLREVSFTTSSGKQVKFRATINKMGGTLRRGWTARTHQEAKSNPGTPQVGDVQNYLNSLFVVRSGNRFQITIINPVEYASYVEFGHRTRGGKGWVTGSFMLTKSEQELSAKLNVILEPLVEEFLIRSLGGDGN